VATNGREAAALIEQNTYDVVVTDIRPRAPPGAAEGWARWAIC